MMGQTLYRFPAQLPALGEVLARLEQAAAGLGDELVLRAQTALEELFTNSVLHGNVAHDAQACIWLAVGQGDESDTRADQGASTDIRTGCGPDSRAQVRQVPGQLHVVFEDAFDAFDPFQHLDAVLLHTQAELDARPIGGLGRLLVYELADEASYQRVNGRNRVELTFIRR